MNRPVLIVEQQDGVRWLTLNRPERRNALNPELVAALDEEVHRIEADDTVRAVAVRGAGASFCAGGDFSAFLDASGPRGPIDFLSDLTECFARIERSTKPWVAVLHGHAIAGGLELALVCDVVIAARGTLVGDGHLTNRLVPAGGSSVRLERAVGRGVARWLHLSGETLPVEELIPTGWIHAVADAGSLDGLAASTAARLGTVDSRAQQRMKRLLIDLDEMGADGGLQREVDAFGANWTASDVPTALRAFLAGTRAARSHDARNSEEVA